MTRTISPYDEGAHAARRIGLLLAVALHAVAIAAILAHPPTRALIAAAAPAMVYLLSPQPAVQPKFEVPPKARPIRHRSESNPSIPIEPLPPAAASIDTAAPIVAPETRAHDLPPVDAVRANFQSVPETVTAAVLPPRFDAAYLQNPPPPYPPLARRLGEHGRVLLRVFVTPAGLADRVELKASSGSERLDRAAQDAVKHWRFVPALQGDRPVPAWVVVPISFSLS